jgi:hypothetical protein
VLLHKGPAQASAARDLWADPTTKEKMMFKRIATAGVLLIAALAFSGVAVSAASAALPTLLLLSGAPPVELKGSNTTAKTKLTTKLGELTGEGVLIQLHWTNLNTGSLGPASLLFTEVEEKTTKCHTTNDGTGLVLIDNAEWHIVPILLSPLQVGILFLVPKFKITCGAVTETVEGNSVSTATPLEAWVEPSGSFKGGSFCATTSKPEITKYWNDTPSEVSAKLEAEINGLGKKEEACEAVSEEVSLVPTQMLEVMG